ncbi:hypothetical protein GCM10009865_01070 [Aeromicrobium ponti]|uniref:Uncharacterized protein DUF4214 n=1 Tax=Cytobacillus oceanisediminis TaxID=665099 RepID=A0A562K564_9BACI|nr:DUF4214 domain-containing protein [Cytobacillus oceanisediminis]TWH90572.1 uncharacterized protein DUF4214 [Cytobacillus oceanisediminis]
MRIVQIIQEIYKYGSSQFVKELYREILNREPDDKELNNYIEALKKGVKKETILSSFFRSNELFSKLNTSVCNDQHVDLSKKGTIFTRLQLIIQRNRDPFIEEVFQELLNRKPNKKDYSFPLLSRIRSNKDKIDLVIFITKSREFTSLIKFNNKNAARKPHNIKEKITADMVLKKIISHYRKDKKYEKDNR